MSKGPGLFFSDSDIGKKAKALLTREGLQHRAEVQYLHHTQCLGRGPLRLLLSRKEERESSETWRLPLSALLRKEIEGTVRTEQVKALRRGEQHLFLAPSPSLSLSKDVGSGHPNRSAKKTAITRLGVA
ncbi:Uncharacterized protein Rs2_03728 [Raphanus sativus]|nr:Uncharacterized protein Rs2_03728 [Raphanus sativus]